MTVPVVLNSFMLNVGLVGGPRHASAGGVEASWAFDAAIDRLAAPLGHASLTVHVGQCVLWALPS